VVLEKVQEFTLWQLLAQRVNQTPNLPMLINGEIEGEVLTFKACFDKAQSLAAGLQQQGIKPGDVVAWQFPTGPEAIILSLALSRLDVIQNPVLHLYQGRELVDILSQSVPQWVIVPASSEDASYATRVSSVLDESTLDAAMLVLEAEFYVSDISALPEHSIENNKVRWIYCTSGTTSGPKGVLHTDASLIAGGYGLATAMGTTVDDTGSIAYPYAHIGGSMYLVMVLMMGIPVVLLKRFQVEVAAEIFRKYGVTLAGGSTAHYQAWLELQRRNPGQPVVPSMRILAGGGASKPPHLYFDLKAEMGVTVLHAYGMTESPLVAHNSPSNTEYQLAHTEGQPIPSMELRIQKSDGSEAVTDEEGEILIRGACLCKGYVSSEETAAAFDASGFYHTGDLGRLDEANCLTISGRLKDIIIRKGENIAAREIEEILSQHPNVGQVAVVGLPDESRGEMVCAIFEADCLPITLTEMTAYLADAGLMKQKWPERLECVPAFPRSEALGKISKKDIKQLFVS